MKRSEEKHKIAKQWMKMLAVSALVFLITLIGLFVMGKISQKREISYNEVSVSVKDVNEVKKHHRHNTISRLEVNVVFQGDTVKLHGVNMEDRQKYREALDSHTDITVYEHGNRLYANVDAIRGTGALATIMYLFWIVCILSFSSTFMSVAMCIKSIFLYKRAVAEDADEEKRAATAKRISPPIKRPKNIPNAIKESRKE